MVPKLRLGVMGWPVRQSGSPGLFYKTFAGRSDVLDRFSYDLLEESTFGTAFKRFQQDYYAVNVTTPYKEPAFMAADEASPQCRAIGAANLLIHHDSRVVAHNTDVIAVTDILNRWLREQTGPVCPPERPGAPSGGRMDRTGTPKVLVVGCGGAGKAAITAALSAGVRVTVVNRTPETVLRFIDRLQAHRAVFPAPAPEYAPLTMLPAEVRRTDFVIYTLPVAVAELHLCDFSGRTVLEAKYYDPSIKQIPGMQYIPGTEWLLLQALATYRILGLDPGSRSCQKPLCRQNGSATPESASEFLRCRQ